MVKSSIFTIKDLEAYRERVARTAQIMSNIGWGAQSDCADDLGKQPIVVSHVLRGIMIDVDVLEDIESWLRGEHNKSQGPTSQDQQAVA